MLSLKFSDSKGKPYTIDPRKSIAFAYRRVGSPVIRYILPVHGPVTPFTAGAQPPQTQLCPVRHGRVSRAKPVADCVRAPLICLVSQCPVMTSVRVRLCPVYQWWLVCACPGGYDSVYGVPCPVYRGLMGVYGCTWLVYAWPGVLCTLASVSRP
jgi:hypothetical protein